MEPGIADNEHRNQEQRHIHHGLAVPTLEDAAPHAPEFEEEDAHEHVAEPEPQGILQREEPVSDKGEGEVEEGTVVLHGRGRPAEEPVASLLQKMDGDVGRKEADEEPRGIVAVETPALPDVGPLERFDGIMEAVDEERKEREVDNASYESRRQVGNQEPLGLVGAILAARAQDALVEVACLEEEERHEIIGPLHHLPPPLVVGMAAKGHHVEAHHAYDTDAAEEIKGVVARFRCVHDAKVLNNFQLSPFKFQLFSSTFRSARGLVRRSAPRGRRGRK